jgi:anti-sigma regulatory factor (Ser/Thr protein kinase)
MSRGHPEQGSGTGAAHHVSMLEFAPLPTAIACARLHAVVILREWGLGELTEDAEIIVSELMTNAQRASAGLGGRPPIALRLFADAGRLVIEAWDQAPFTVAPEAPDEDAERGRGLLIVAALSNRWGSEHVTPGVKVVWAELEIPGRP